MNAKRAKDAEKAAYEAIQVAMEQQAANVPVEHVPAPDLTGNGQDAGTDLAMEVDAVIGDAIASTKRKAEDDAQGDGSKKPRTGKYWLTL